MNLRIRNPSGNLLTQYNSDLDMVGKNGTITAAGYSLLAAILAVIVATLMLVALFGVSAFKLKTGMPLVGRKSFAISAACHPPEWDRDAAERPLIWGATRHQEGTMPGHCCLTTSQVETPIVGDLYGGRDKQASHREDLRARYRRGLQR